MKIMPKSKEEIKNELINSVPDDIINVINELLTIKFNARYREIFIKEADIISKCKELDVNYETYSKNKNGIILAYRKEGWEIKYDETRSQLLFY